MKRARVRILKRFKSLDHTTAAYDHIQSAEKLSFRAPQGHSSYKEHECRAREEEFKPRVSIKVVTDCSHEEGLYDDENLEAEIPPPLTMKCPPGGGNLVILYTTSLRGIRKTFDDCQEMKFLLDSFRIVYHERDVSMHLEFREEMWEMLGGKVIPPRLFIRGRHVGGADEVVSLHEQGELKNLLQGLPLVPGNQKCRGCNSLRFVVCCECHGSRKVFRGDARDGSFARCSICNENGLIKCPLCS